MNNLFIVHTPFNLMTSFILQKSVFAEDDNYLAILHPQSFSDWQHEPILKYMHSTDSGYRKVFFLLRWLRSGQGSLRRQVLAVRSEMGGVGWDRIFLPVDIDIQAQLLVAALGKARYCRYDEGMWSYLSASHKRSFFGKRFHLAKMHIMRALAGIERNLEFNAAACGAAVAAECDYLYRPELLLRHPRSVVEISNEMIKKAEGILKDKGFLEQQFDNKSILYLSQPLVEKGEVEEKDELSALLNIVRTCCGQARFIYKPHSRDSKEKIERYKKAVPNMEVFDSKVPVELLYAAEPNLEAVISYASSGLLFVDKFAHSQIKTFSLADISRKAVDADTRKTLQKAGVAFLLK